MFDNRRHVFDFGTIFSFEAHPSKCQAQKVLLLQENTLLSGYKSRKKATFDQKSRKSVIVTSHVSRMICHFLYLIGRSLYIIC